jgi:hypothetical protein
MGCGPGGGARRGGRATMGRERVGADNEVLSARVVQGEQ